MDILKNKSDDELLKSLLAEIAKAKNELGCANQDLKKADNRLRFLIVLANTLIDRNGDK